MSWAFVLNLLFSGMCYTFVDGIKTNMGTMSEYGQGVTDDHRHSYEQCSYNLDRSDSMKTLEPPRQVLHEKIDTNSVNSYEKCKGDVDQNEKKMYTGNHKQRKQLRQRIFRRGTITKFINEWILFVFILHCLFAGALLDHIGTHWNIQFASEL